ncbi:MAG: sulfotransferase family 2 domain-containing protein [Pseudomonadota bacterium]
MPLYLNNEQAVTFLHIPKTAGTTIEAWLNNSGKYQQILFSQKKLEGMLVTPQHLGYHTLTELTKALSRPLEYKFAVVRNPFERIVSEFFYRIKLGSIQLGVNSESLFSAWVVHNLKKYQETPELLDNHLRPQTYYVNDDVDVFKLEDGIQNVLETVGKHIGLHENTQVEAKKVGDKKNVWWSCTAIEMVLELYEEDFERFGYSNSTSSLEVVSSMFKIKKFEAIYTSKLIKKKLMRKLR